MRGDAKKNAMQQLGVGWDYQPHPWQQAVSATDSSRQGHKWWAHTSEK